jgi:hypothetical protein
MVPGRHYKRRYRQLLVATKTNDQQNQQPYDAFVVGVADVGRLRALWLGRLADLTGNGAARLLRRVAGRAYSHTNDDVNN